MLPMGGMRVQAAAATKARAAAKANEPLTLTIRLSTYYRFGTSGA